MSIVGPRPIVQAEAARYGRHFKAYCSVRPGITGIWQVSGRNNVSYRRRILMDALYARRKCVALDVKLILATIPAVLARKGSY
jgi:lipopolysaccharide/colanic/teichoic acid biosynthesis glycosyltransferase